MSPEEKHCPICKNPNRCDVQDIGGCWCARVTIPGGLLKPAGNRSCICAGCVEAYRKSPEEFTALNRTRPV